jgi:hypothetical protein
MRFSLFLFYFERMIGAWACALLCGCVFVCVRVCGWWCGGYMRASCASVLQIATIRPHLSYLLSAFHTKRFASEKKRRVEKCVLENGSASRWNGTCRCYRVGRPSHPGHEDSEPTSTARVCPILASTRRACTFQPAAFSETTQWSFSPSDYLLSLDGGEFVASSLRLHVNLLLGVYSGAPE